jgi:hypothetical protein
MQEELNALGKPFAIKPQYTTNDSPRHYANIAKGNGVNMDINFLSQEGILRICLYIYNNPKLYELFKDKQELIESQLGFPVIFDIGGKQNNIKWVKSEWHFIPNNTDDYKRVLKKTLPDMVCFVDTFKPFMR